MTMKKALQSAIDSADIILIRKTLVDMVSRNPGSASVIEDVTAAVASVPDLFEPDDGKAYPASPYDMTETLIESLSVDMSRNFSLPKFRLFVETQAVLHRNPKLYSRTAPENDAATSPGESALLSEPDSVTTAAGHVRSGRKTGTLRRIAYVIMAAGVAAAVVGLCVSLKFLLGVGIGVVMLGSAIAYRAIMSRDRRLHSVAEA